VSSDAMREFLEIVEAEVQSRPAATEFEMAYQARVAMDRIRFAIKHTEQFGPRTDQMREAGMQLLDALQRLETADRRFQERSRLCAPSRNVNNQRTHETVNGASVRASHGSANRT
jgi:hypothetical protein